MQTGNTIYGVLGEYKPLQVVYRLAMARPCQQREKVDGTKSVKCRAGRGRSRAEGVARSVVVLLQPENTSNTADFSLRDRMALACCDAHVMSA